MFDKVKTKIKSYLLENIVSGYLTSFLKRLDGYKSFLGIILTIFYVAAQMITDPNVSGILAVFIKAFSGVTEGHLDAADISVLASSFLAIWGIIQKLIKKHRGIPQVPTIVIEKD